MSNKQLDKKIMIKDSYKTEEQKEENIKKLEKTIGEIVAKNYSGAQVKMKF